MSIKLFTLVGPTLYNHKDPWVLTHQSSKLQHHLSAILKDKVVVITEESWDAIEKSILHESIIGIVSTANEVHDQENFQIEKLGNTFQELILWAAKAYPNEDVVVLVELKDILNVQDCADYIQIVWVNNPEQVFTAEYSDVLKNFGGRINQHQFAEHCWTFCVNERKAKKEYHFFTPPTGPSKDSYKGDAD